MNKSGDLKTVSSISYKVDSVSKLQIEERLGVSALAMLIINFDSDGIEEYDSLVAPIEYNECRLKSKKLELDMKHH